MADYKVTDTELTSIANAIRTKGGTSNQLVFPTGFVSAVQAIPTGGGGELPSRTASEAGGTIHAETLTDGTNIYIKWWFEGVSFGSAGYTITDSVLSTWVPEGKALYNKFMAKAYASDKATYIGDICFEYGVLKMLSLPNHSSWISADNAYAIMYTSVPFDLLDLTTIGGAEGAVQQNTYSDPS